MIAAGPAVDAIETGIKQRSKGEVLVQEQKQQETRGQACSARDAGAIPSRPLGSVSALPTAN